MSYLYRLKSLIPKRWLQPYHFVLAHLASWWYGHPGRELIVIGVTGTNGKTTTSYLIAKALEASGFATGCTTTAIMKVGAREWVNKTKMTMPGRFFIQRTLREMVDAGCRYAVIETSSQGLIQFRQVGVPYDVAVFTNLTPEHLEAHGGFENYKFAKALLFDAVANATEKRLAGEVVPKVFVVNRESEHSSFYTGRASHIPVVWYGLDVAQAEVAPHEVVYEANTTKFFVGEYPVTLHLPGKHNLENALATLAVCRVLGVDMRAATEALSAVPGVPGRLERIEGGQPWTVIIDYAYEPEALARCVEALRHVPHRRLIHVLGSCGGGRDVSRRPLLGAFAATHADIAIVTNEDPYDDDPQDIIDQIVAGAVAGGKRVGENVFSILDREEAIAMAMRMAEPGDLVLLTGKGCEPWICVANGEKLAWDERAAALKGIHRVLQEKGAD